MVRATKVYTGRIERLGRANAAQPETRHKNKRKNAWKIIYVTAYLPHGSDEAFLIPEVKQLMRSGHEVLVVPALPARRIVHGHELVKWTRGRSPSLRVLKAAVAETLAGPVKQQERWDSCSVAGRDGCNQNLAIVPKALWLARVLCGGGPTTSTATGRHHGHHDHVASRRSDIPWSFTAHRWTS